MTCEHASIETRVLLIAGKIVHKCRACGIEVHHDIPPKYRAKIIHHPSEMEPTP